MDTIDTQTADLSVGSSIADAMTEANTVADALKLADELKSTEVFVQTNEDLDVETETAPTIQ